MPAHATRRSRAPAARSPSAWDDAEQTALAAGRRLLRPGSHRLAGGRHRRSGGSGHRRHRSTTVSTLNNGAQAQCGAALLTATANRCDAVLAAESGHIRNLAEDSDGSILAADKAAAERSVLDGLVRHHRFRLPDHRDRSRDRRGGRRSHGQSGARHDRRPGRVVRPVLDDLADRHHRVSRQGADADLHGRVAVSLLRAARLGQQGRHVLPGRRRMLGGADVLGAGLRSEREPRRRRQPEQRVDGLRRPEQPRQPVPRLEHGVRVLLQL